VGGIPGVPPTGFLYWHGKCPRRYLRGHFRRAMPVCRWDQLAVQLIGDGTVLLPAPMNPKVVVAPAATVPL
jgi:hypothetical protein